MFKFFSRLKKGDDFGFESKIIDDSAYYDKFMNKRKNITSIVILAVCAIIVLGLLISAFVVSHSKTGESYGENNSKNAELYENTEEHKDNLEEQSQIANQIKEREESNKNNENTNTTTADNSIKEQEVILPTPNDGYKEVNETVYATTTVHVRAGASTETASLGTLFTEDKLTRTGIGQDGWSRVIYRGQNAYVFSEYLTTEAPPERPVIDVNIRGNSEIDPNKPMVALTFDDGPNPSSTRQILKTLQKYNVRATFFDLGNLMKAYPDTVKMEEEAGCEVASHTYSHKNLNKLSAEEVAVEQTKTEEQMQEILGHKSNLIRPPYGNASNTVRDVFQNYGLIGWDIDTLDWKSKNANAILSEIRKFSDYDGRIVLMHSIYPTTADAVETIVPELLNKGYQLVTVSEMIKYKGATLEGGKLYYNFRNE